MRSMMDEIGSTVSWPAMADRLRRTDEIPALALRGTWVNRPPLAEPQRGAFELTHRPGDGWHGPRGAGEPASIVADPASWFTDPATGAVELPGRETVAGRLCSRLLVSYSRHSAYRMLLWLDAEWPLVLAARSEDPAGRLEHPRFELRVTEIGRAGGRPPAVGRPAVAVRV